MATPFENVTGLLGSSAAWKKYFPGLQTRNLGASYKTDEPAKPDAVFTSPLPSFKGIDFSTGKPVDLNQYSSFAIGTQPPLAQQTPGLEYEGYNALPTNSELARIQSLKDVFYDPQRYAQMRELESAYTLRDIRNLYPFLSQAGREATQRSLGASLTYDINAPTKQQARAASQQQQMATAAGSEAALLGAVSDASYKAAMANIAGLRSGMRGG